MTGPLLAAVQHEHPRDPRTQVPRILDKAARAVEDGGVAVLPEYFYRSSGEPLGPKAAEELGFVEDAVLDASRGTDGAIVATVPEVGGDRLHNTVLVAEGGQERLRQPKLVPTEPERSAGVQAGEGLATAQVQGLELGVLVCADVLNLDLVARMARRDPDVVAVPVMSPNRERDSTRRARTSVFVARAWDLGAYVVKAGGYSRPDVVGRSLITAPWGVEAQARDPFASTILSCRVDTEGLAEAREPFDPMRGDQEADP